MNNPETEITQFGIIVIQSLSEGDRKTGEELHNDVLRYKQFLNQDSFVVFYDVSTVQEFIETLEIIEKSLVKEQIFSLHIETHGSEFGIHLSSGEYVSWEQFFDKIRPINIKMGNLLLVIMSMCKGAAITSYIVPELRAPYKAFIGSTRDLTEDEVARGFNAFYSEYTSMLDIVEGMKALDFEIDGPDPVRKTFWCLSSREVFDLTLDPDRDPSLFKKMVEQQLSRFIEKGETHRTFAEVEDIIRRMLKDTSESHRDFFNFKDHFGE